MKRLLVLPVIGGLLLGGCVSADITGTPRRIDPDDESVDGGLSSQDIRTVASRMCPAILSVPEIANGVPPVRIAVAEMKNSSRFFIDRNLFTKKLLVELNRYGRGTVRFINNNERVQEKRIEVLKDRQETDIRRQIAEVANAIASNPIFAGRATPAKIAVIPALNTNLVNLNADSFAAMLREEVLNASGGKILFLMPGHVEGADYWLTGQFYPVSLKREGIINLADYFDVITERIKSGKSLYLDSSVTTVSTPETTTTTMAATKEDDLLQMLRSPDLRAIPNAEKRLNVMIVRPQDKLSVFEKSLTLNEKIRPMSGNASLVLSGEISGLSQAQNGTYNDYLHIAFELVDPNTNETVWQDGYEVKRVSSVGTVYR